MQDLTHTNEPTNSHPKDPNARSTTVRPNGIVDFEPSPEFFPFTSRWFESSVGPVHYVDEGEGRPLIMFHGNPDWSFLYRGMISELKDRYRTIAMDYPGFGLSVHPGDDYGYTPAEHAAVVLELIEYLDLEDAVVIGADWGGPIGLDVASRIPDRISGIVMGNTWFWPTDGRMMLFFSRLMSSAPMQRLITRRNFFVNPAMKRTIVAEISDAEFHHYEAVVPTPESRRGIAEFPKQIRRSESWLAELEERVVSQLSDKEIHIVWGTKDPVFRSILDKWIARFPEAAVTRLDNASHYLQDDDPKAIAEAIAASFPPQQSTP